MSLFQKAAAVPHRKVKVVILVTTKGISDVGRDEVMETRHYLGGL